MTVESIVALAAGLLGLSLGSFLNVCVWRWPQDQSVVKPPSHCPGCDTPIRWFDNIPVLGWIFLGGRCRSCKGRISMQYPLIELAVGLIWAGLFYLHGPSPEALRGSLFVTILLGIALADARFYIIPDQFSIGGAVLGLALAPLAGGLTIVQALVGAAVGYVTLWLVAVLGEKAFKKEAMGGGDIKMMAMVGAFLGTSGVFLTIFLGSLFGAVIFGPISLKTKKLVPFGIFLALGAAITYGWGEALIDWYLTTVVGI